MSNAFDHGHGGHGGGGVEQGQQGADNTLLCYLHPRELLVGVCAHCLRERLLLLLASKQQGGGRARVPADGTSYLSARPHCRALRRVRTGSIVSSLLRRLDTSRHHNHDVVHGDGGEKINPDADADDAASVASLDDSFISIKFEDDGKATWMDTQNQLKAPAGGDADAMSADKAPAASSATTTVVEHARRGGVRVTRWRKQVLGRLLQLARWKRTSTGGKQASSTAAAACLVADQQRSKERGSRSWIRSLTRRRARAAHGERAWS